MSVCGLCGSIPRKAPIVSFPDINKDGKYPNKTWMGDLVATDSRATLKRMVLPGSHDSASYSIPSIKIGSAIGKTQNLTIREQLLCGVRFLDLRIASGIKAGGSVNIFHGRLMGCSFEEVLGEIRGFCVEHPTEFVVLYVQAEHGRPFSATDKAMALKLMRSHFGSPSDPTPKRLLCKATRRGEILSTPLEKLVAKRGRVCVLLNPRIYNYFVVNGIDHNADYVKNEYGFFDAAYWLRDKWHNTTDTLELLESNLREIRNHKAHVRRYFVNSQFVLTPTFERKNIGGYITGKTSLQPATLSNKFLYKPPRGNGIPVLHQMIMEHPDEDWNVLSLDFVDLAPAALQMIVGMNFGPLEIELALLGGANGARRSAEDVTDFVRSKVLKGSCLLLHPKNEFDHLIQDPETSLTLVYKISKKIYTIIVALSDLATTHVVVLNQHNHLLAGGIELSLGAGSQGNGTIPARRRSGVTVTWQKTETQSYRFGYLDESITEQYESWTE